MVRNIWFCCLKLTPCVFHYVFPTVCSHEECSLPLQWMPSYMHTYELSIISDDIVQGRSLLRVNRGSILWPAQESQAVWSLCVWMHVWLFRTYAKKQCSNILISLLPECSPECIISLHFISPNTISIFILFSL